MCLVSVLMLAIGFSLSFLKFEQANTTFLTYLIDIIGSSIGSKAFSVATCTF